MVQNRVQFVVDEQGRYLRTAPLGNVRAFSDVNTIIELVTAFPIESFIECSFNIYDSRDMRIASFMLPTIDKGKDVIDETDPLYQQCADWSVFRVAITASLLTNIARFRAGRVGIAFAISDSIQTVDMVDFMGYFGTSGFLPATASAGQYYICDTYNFLDKGILWNKGSVAIYNAGWKRVGRLARLTTSTMDIPVATSVYSHSQELTGSEYNQIISLVLSEISTINNIKQVTLIAGNGINIAQGLNSAVISTQTVVSNNAEIKVFGITTSQWIGGQIVITPAEHGFGNTPNLFVQVYTADIGVVYDSPTIALDGTITLYSDIPFNGSILIAGGLAKGITSITKISTVDRVDTYEILFSDNSTSTFEIINGEQGIQGDPSTRDLIGTPSIIGDLITVDLDDIYTGVYGTVDNPIIINTLSTIQFTHTNADTDYQKSVILYIKRTAEVAIVWSNITAFYYNEIPILPVGAIRKIQIESSSATTFYGEQGGYINV